MPLDYDVLIAGAGPAGCAAAYDLALGGKRVLLLDRRSFPRPKACACGLTRKTLAALRYSVDPIVELRCDEIVLQRAGTDSGAPHLASEMWVADKAHEIRVRERSPIAAMAVREHFDAFCLAQTLAAGAKGGSVALLKTDTLLGIDEHPDHIALTFTTAAGRQTLTAEALIGADGSNGQTRRMEAALSGRKEVLGRKEMSGRKEVLGRKEMLGRKEVLGRKEMLGRGFSPAVKAAGKDGASAPEGMREPAWYSRGFALEANVPYTALPAALPQGDAPHDLVFDFAPIPGGYGWLFPKGDHINIGIGAFAPDDNPEKLKLVTRQLLADYTRTKLGLDLAALPNTTTGQHLGMGGHLYLPQGRVLLVGDAAGLVDPLTGEGIHSAIVSGQAAAAAILGAPHAIAPAYAHHLAPLQQTLAFSHRAAQAFYKRPARGFKVMRFPGLSRLVLKTYADGLGGTRLLGWLAKLVS